VHCQFAVGSVRTLARVGRWLLPWFCVLVVSGGIAFAAGQAAVAKLKEPPEVPAYQPADPGAHWVIIESVAEDGSKTSIVCRVHAASITTDVISVRAKDMNVMIAGLCSEVWGG
jgi:hypothetical protein